MSIKKILFNFLLTKRQKEIIYKAIVYSEYKYRQRGDINDAIKVHSVLDEVGGLLGLQQTYTKDEVDTIVDILMKESKNIESQAVTVAYNKGYEAAIRKIKKQVEEQLGVSISITPIQFEKVLNDGDGKDEAENKERESENKNEDNSQQEDVIPKNSVLKGEE